MKATKHNQIYIFCSSPIPAGLLFYKRILSTPSLCRVAETFHCKVGQMKTQHSRLLCPSFLKTIRSGGLGVVFCPQTCLNTYPPMAFIFTTIRQAYPAPTYLVPCRVDHQLQQCITSEDLDNVAGSQSIIVPRQYNITSWGVPSQCRLTWTAKQPTFTTQLVPLLTSVYKEGTHVSFGIVVGDSSRSTSQTGPLQLPQLQITQKKWSAAFYCILTEATGPQWTCLWSTHPLSTSAQHTTAQLTQICLISHTMVTLYDF